jgi:phosphoribosylanthranilate isomerase
METVRVKICGITNEEDLYLCVKSGVDALGFVVEYPVDVPWNIPRGRARELMQKVPPFVAVTAVVGGEMEHILSIADFTMPDVMQLHGEESLRETDMLVKELSKRGVRVIKALRINIEEDLKALTVMETAKRFASTGISALLLDSKTSDMPAGTGMPFNWEIAKQVRDAVDVPLIIAGGLNSGNVRDAIKSIKPFAVDVISGVERSPGRKDKRKVQEFIRAVKGAYLFERR